MVNFDDFDLDVQKIGVAPGSDMSPMSGSSEQLLCQTTADLGDGGSWGVSTGCSVNCVSVRDSCTCPPVPTNGGYECVTPPCPQPTPRPYTFNCTVHC